MPSEVQTKSGICINIRGCNPSSILLFDKPVRTVELSPEEALQIGSSLIRGVRADIDPREQKRSSKIITICGSMKFLQEMKEAKGILEKRGYSVRVPPLVDPAILKEGCTDDQSFLVTKWEMMKRHIASIRESDAILVINLSKGDMTNYIGINTLLEIGAAFESEKAIFLLNEPSKNMEEIWALKPEIVNGLANLKNAKI